MTMAFVFAIYHPMLWPWPLDIRKFRGAPCPANHSAVPCPSQTVQLQSSLPPTCEYYAIHGIVSQLQSSLPPTCEYHTIHGIVVQFPSSIPPAVDYHDCFHGIVGQLLSYLPPTCEYHTIHGIDGHLLSLYAQRVNTVPFKQCCGSGSGGYVISWPSCSGFGFAILNYRSGSLLFVNAQTLSNKLNNLWDLIICHLFENTFFPVASKLSR